MNGIASRRGVRPPFYFDEVDARGHGVFDAVVQPICVQDVPGTGFQRMLGKAAGGIDRQHPGFAYLHLEVIDIIAGSYPPEAGAAQRQAGCAGPSIAVFNGLKARMNGIGSRVRADPFYFDEVDARGHGVFDAEIVAASPIVIGCQRGTVTVL